MWPRGGKGKIIKGKLI